jgi:hypothetical protein
MSALDSTHRTFLEHELAQVDRQIADLQGTRSYLRGRLGLPDNDSQDEVAPTGAAVAPAGADLSTLVNPGQYGGMSGVKAARALLEKVGRERPLTTREIYDAITAGGVKLKGTDVLTKVMKRSGRFHRPVPGRWGLVEWYPASVVSRGLSELQDESEEDVLGNLADESDNGENGEGDG